MSKVASEWVGDKSPIFYRIIANLSSRDIDNRTLDEFYLSLRVVAIELDNVLCLSNIEVNLFVTIRILSDKVFDAVNPWHPTFWIGRHIGFV